MVAGMARRRRLLGRVLLGALLVVIVAAAAGYWYARPPLLTGTGYAAHNACALRHIAGREDAASDLPPNPLVPYLRTVLGFLGITDVHFIFAEGLNMGPESAAQGFAQAEADLAAAFA